MSVSILLFSRLHLAPGFQVPSSLPSNISIGSVPVNTAVSKIIGGYNPVEIAGEIMSISYTDDGLFMVIRLKEAGTAQQRIDFRRQVTSMRQLVLTDVVDRSTVPSWIVDWFTDGSSVIEIYVNPHSSGNPLRMSAAAPGDKILFSSSVTKQLNEWRPDLSASSESSGSPLESPIYAGRAESGLYDSVADQIAAMTTDALANIDYPDHFTRIIEDWSKNFKYMDKNGAELRTALVGEIVGPAMGTILRAHGNYFARDGDNFKPIDDKSKIKDTIAICAPTCGTTKMFNTYLNQINTLGQITDDDADEDARKGNSPFVRPWTKASREGYEHDIIVTHMLPKYAVPSAAGAPKVKRTPKRKLDQGTEEPAQSEPAETALTLPADADIKLGAHYDPALLPDYGGDYFNHIKAKLVQLDVRDVNNKLIAPWNFYDALRPGTLVLILASLHCFLMTDENSKDKKERKIYQINAHSIRVLSESDEPVEKRTRPVAPNSAERAISNLPARSVPAGFSSFKVPVAVATSSGESSTSSATASSSASASARSESGDAISDHEDAGSTTVKGKNRATKRAKRDWYISASA
ncbi:hypothetical protein C8R43DRAFT_1126376 [Mycena crocata]|nr:hypothetical protein C8R43DRAFT_1126376 [Mycena crocata]